MVHDTTSYCEVLPLTSSVSFRTAGAELWAQTYGVRALWGDVLPCGRAGQQVTIVPSFGRCCRHATSCYKILFLQSNVLVWTAVAELWAPDSVRAQWGDVLPRARPCQQVTEALTPLYFNSTIFRTLPSACYMIPPSTEVHCIGFNRWRRILGAN